MIKRKEKTTQNQDDVYVVSIGLICTLLIFSLPIVVSSTQVVQSATIEEQDIKGTLHEIHNNCRRQ